MTEDPGTCKGFFPIPNVLLAEGCRRPVALAVYARLASTPHIWTVRGSLQPYQVRASLNELKDATGATWKQVRGALAWLIREGFVVRLDTAAKTKAVFRLVTGAQTPPGATQGAPTTSRTAPKAERHRLAEKGTDEGTDRAQRKPKRANDLQSFSQPPRAQTGAKVLEEVENKTTTPPPPPPEGDVVKMWSDAWNGSPPREPKARDADKYRRTVLQNATAGETREDVRRMFASWVAARDPDWGHRQGDGVAEFAKRVGFWIECRNVERAHRKRRARAAVTDSPGDRHSPGALTALAGSPGLSALTGEGVGADKPVTPTGPATVQIPPHPTR